MTLDSETLTTPTLDVTTNDPGTVVRATIDRPETHNALNGDTLDALADVVTAADASPARVVVIRGRGGTFCSGGDLSDFGDPEALPMSERRRRRSKLADLFEAMMETSALTVAGVEGYCLAGGCGLAAACEFVVAADDAEFGTPEVEVGMFPMQAMAAIVPAVLEKQALKMLFTGERLSATRAREVGLVTDVLPAATFDEDLADFVEALAANSPTMISMGKEAFYAQRDMETRQSLAYLREMLVLLMESDDHREGIAAFREDRDPEWQSGGES